MLECVKPWQPTQSNFEKQGLHNPIKICVMIPGAPTTH